VVLDIGPHAGALVVYAPEARMGAEIEIRPAGHPWRGAHTAVRERHLPDGIRYAGVFGSLEPGTYDLRVKTDESGDPLLTVRVPAGVVTETAF
jgi:hypothetical protein